MGIWTVSLEVSADCWAELGRKTNPCAMKSQGVSASKANGFNGTYGRGGGDRTRDPRPTSPVLVRFHQPKARSRISPSRQRLPKDSATHNGREEAAGRVGQFTALSKS